MKKIWIVIILTALAIIAGAIIVIQTNRDLNVIKIGVILPLTGESSVWGQSMKQGIDLAVSEINYLKGIDNKKISLLYEDDRGNKTDGSSAIRKLIYVDNVKFILGVANSSVAKAIIPIIDDYNNKNKAKVIFISGGASSHELTGISPYFFRTWPSDIEEEIAMAKFVAKNRFNRIAILYMNNDYGIDMMQSFSKQLDNENINVLAKESFGENDTDIRSQLIKLKYLSPDAIYLVGNPKGIARCLVQSKELGLHNQFLSSSAIIEPEVIKIAGDASDGVLFTDASIDISGGGDKINGFLKEFRNLYKSDPGMLALSGYDSAYVLLESIKNAGNSSDAIKKYIENSLGFDTLGGRVKFIDGDIKRSIRIGIIKDRKFVNYGSVD